MADEPSSSRAGVAEGLAVFEALRGHEHAESMRSAIDSPAVGADMQALAMEFIFGRIWSRDGLEAKHRSLVTISLLIALRQPDELKNHLRIGLTNGLTVREIEEAILQAAAYAGFPAAHVASKALAEVLRDPAVFAK